MTKFVQVCKLLHILFQFGGAHSINNVYREVGNPLITCLRIIRAYLIIIFLLGFKQDLISCELAILYDLLSSL